MSENTYAEKLIETSTKTGSIVCFGLDPVIDLERKIKEDGTREKPKRIPDSLVDANIKKHGKTKGLGKAIEEFYIPILDGLDSEGDIVASLKPNYSTYAQFGEPLKGDFSGLMALGKIIKHAKDLGFSVILDYKRGDIGTTSAAYAIEGLLKWDADAVTVAPYMGSDSVAPFIKLAHKKGKGVYILNRTSNRGAKDLQNLTVEGKNENLPFYLEVSRCIKDEWSKGYEGTVCIVVGATTPEEYGEITTYFGLGTTFESKCIPSQLIPGFGSQGGSAEVIFEEAIKVYQTLEFDKEQIEVLLKTKRANSSSGLNYAWNLLPGFDESNCVEAAIKATKKFNEQIQIPLTKYGLRLR